MKLRILALAVVIISGCGVPGGGNGDYADVQDVINQLCPPDPDPMAGLVLCSPQTTGTPELFEYDCGTYHYFQHDTTGATWMVVEGKMKCLVGYHACPKQTQEGRPMPVVANQWCKP